MIKKIMHPKLFLILILCLTPTALFSADIYWNLGEGSFSLGFAKESQHMGGQFEFLNFYFREPKTNLGLKLTPFRGYISSAIELLENDDGTFHTEGKGELKGSIGTGIDLFWSPLNVTSVSRCGPFVSLYGGVYPNPEFQVFIGVEFLWALPMLFKDSKMPWVVDIIHVRAGFWTQDQTFCVTVGIDLTTIALLILNGTYGGEKTESSPRDIFGKDF